MNACAISVFVFISNGPPAQRDRLADRLAAVEHDDARLVPVAGGQRYRPRAGLVHGVGPGDLPGLHGAAGDGHLAGQDVEEGAVSAGQQVFEPFGWAPG